MEAVAAVASIAAILGLVGQSLAGVEQICTFCSEMAAAHEIMEKLRRDVETLLRTLYDVQRLLERIPADADHLHLASLKIHLEDCALDVSNWVGSITQCSSRLRITMKRKKLERIRREIHRNRGALSTTLAVLGRSMDIHTSHQIHHVNTTMEGFNEDFLSMHEAQEMAIGRIEDFAKSYEVSSNSSICTLDSISSSLSRLESRFASFASTQNVDPIKDGNSTEDDRRSPEIFRNHNFYNMETDADGLYHCPFVETGCSHPPDKLKCNYDKHIDSHLKPYRCQRPPCKQLEFPSMSTLLRHEREAHGMHGHGEKPFLCEYPDCARSAPHNGFSRRWNLLDHMKRVHSHQERALDKNNPTDHDQQVLLSSTKMPPDFDHQQPPSDKDMPTPAPDSDQQRKIAASKTRLAKLQERIIQTSNDSKDPVTEMIDYILLPAKKAKHSPEQLWLFHHRCSNYLPEGKRLENMTWRLLAQKSTALAREHEKHFVENEVSVRYLARAEHYQLNEKHIRDSANPSSRFQSVLPFHSQLPDIWQSSSGSFPPDFLQYVVLTLNLRSLESYYKILDLLLSQKATTENDKDNEDLERDFQGMRRDLIQGLEVLKIKTASLRKNCIIAGHSTYEVDAIMRDWTAKDHTDEYATHPLKPANHQDMFEIRKHTQDSQLLDGWSTTRDRINRWLLHSLRSDERQAQLHKSMLAESDIDDEAWARNVLKHWNTDEAATGIDICASLSVGAVDSRDESKTDVNDFVSCLEWAEEDGVLDQSV